MNENRRGIVERFDGHQPLGVGMSQELILDLRCAAGIDIPVLITAADRVAAWIAQVVHTGSRRSGRRLLGYGVSGTDQDVEGLASCLSEAPSTLLVSDVSRLTSRGQAFLEEWLANQSGRSSPAVRLIATSPVRLYDLVVRGAFSEELFYRLNKIHIDASHLSADALPEEEHGSSTSRPRGCDELLSHSAERTQ